MVARRAHNPEVVGSSPASATIKDKSQGLSFFCLYISIFTEICYKNSKFAFLINFNISVAVRGSLQIEKESFMEDLDYNTQREKLQMPEYGRHVQKMVEYVAAIPDKEKRNEQIQAVVQVMGTLNPQLRDINDFKHKLWDHVQVISDFKIDIDSPYPTPTRESLSTAPAPIPLQKTPVKAAHYGRNIQNMIEVIAEREDDEVKTHMIKTLASYMKQQYLIWNKDSVSEETIFNDIYKLSDGRITVPEEVHIGMGVAQKNHRNNNNQKGGKSNGNNNNGKRWKNNKQ